MDRLTKEQRHKNMKNTEECIKVIEETVFDERLNDYEIE